MEATMNYPERVCPNCGHNLGCDDCSVITEIESVCSQVHDLEDKILQLKERIVSIYEDVLNAFMTVVDKKDHYTHRHSTRVTELSIAIAYAMKLDSRSRDTLGRAAKLHDLGKIAVSETILRKPGKLTPEEFVEVKKHPDNAVDILKGIHFLSDIIEVIHAHHERWDGQGYPRRLKGHEIPLLSRIIGIADAIDAMSLSRVYRRPMTHDEIIDELKRESGKQFDPEIVKIIINGGINFGLS